MKEMSQDTGPRLTVLNAYRKACSPFGVHLVISIGYLMKERQPSSNVGEDCTHPVEVDRRIGIHIGACPLERCKTIVSPIET